MKTLFVIALAISSVLVSCAAPVASAPGFSDPRLAATSAQAALNEAGSQLTATVERQVEIESTSDARTETAFQSTLSADRTESARTQQAVDVAVLEQAANKTATVSAVATESARTQQETNAQAINAREWGATQRSAMSNVVIGFVVVFIVVGAIMGVGLRVYFDSLRQQSAERHEFSLQRQRDLHEIELLQQRLQAFVSAVRETNAGTLAALPDGTYAVLPPSTPVQGSKLISDLPAAPVIVNHGEKSYWLEGMTAEEAEAIREARAEMVEWIELSVDWHNQHGKSGNREHQLKRWSNIGKDSSWQSRVAAYFGLALVASNAGTYACDGSTLGELRTKVRSGQIMACVHTETRTGTAQHSPARAETVGVEG